MGERLQGKVAIVTGSTSGIGAGIVRALAAEGARVVVSGRRQPEGEAVVAEIRAAGGTALFLQADVANPEECGLLCRRAVEEFGRLDILVNNAGIFPRVDFAEVTPEYWDRIFDTNVRGPFFCCQAAAPLLRAAGGGSIINIGSVNAFGVNRERILVYGTSKTALYGLTMNLARLLAPDRIRVNWITVGWVLTDKEFEIQAGEGRDAQAMLANAPQLPMGEYSTVEDVAHACVYLASEEAVRVTGANVNAGAGLGIHV